MRLQLFLFLFSCLSITGLAQGPQTTINVHINGSQTRPALLYLPDDYSSTTTQYPLLVFLHGAGESSSSGQLSKIYNSSTAGGPAYFIAHGQWPTAGFVNPADGQTYKFIVVSPQASSWSISATELTYIVSDLLAAYRINSNRIYLMGISAGGQGIMNYAGRIGVTPTYKPAAVAPLSASLYGPDKPTIISNTTADSVRAWGQGQTTGCDLHGESTRDIVVGMNNLRPGIARFTEITGCHSVWNTWIVPTYKENVNGVPMNIYEWMLQYARGTSAPVNQPPTVNAGANQTITLPTNSVNVSATAADPDGSVVGYQWTKLAGGPATITFAGSASTSITGLSQGSYTFRCTVTDDDGATAFDDVNIQVNAQVVTKTANVNLYGNNDPLNAADWNDWNVTASLSKPNLTFSDGTASTITATLSAQTNYFDNGAAYTGFTMCPNKVGRYGSYHSGSRTLTISGLNNNKSYDISLIASANVSSSSTVFSIGSSVVTVAVANNKSISATFVNLTPVSGSIVVNIANGSGSTMNYLNGFRVVEKGSGGNSYVITPGNNGYKSINDVSHQYQPGDTLYLSGHFKNLEFVHLLGAPGRYIVVTNKPGETLIIGDSTWSGGGYSQGLFFRGCRYIEVVGSDKAHFKIVGSNSTVSNEYGPVRGAYLNFGMGDLCSDFICHNLTIRHGGTGIWAKTEVNANNPLTWHPHSKLSNWSFFDIDIYNTYNEGMYIGHTATYWNIQTNQPFYPEPNTPAPDTTIYKRPAKLGNVKIHDITISTAGNDGIQTSAIDTLEVYNNTITNWAANQTWGHGGGILIGGRVKGFHVHDNIVHDGLGEFMQVYAEGGGTSLIENNLLYRNGSGDGVSIRGTDNLVVTFRHNTVAYVGSSAIRINGYFGAPGQNIITKNILAQPRMSYPGDPIYPNFYIYLENGGSAVEPVAPNDNKKFATAAAVNWDENNYFLPNAGSSAVGYGYMPQQPNNLLYVRGSFRPGSLVGFNAKGVFRPRYLLK